MMDSPNWPHLKVSQDRPKLVGTQAPIRLYFNRFHTSLSSGKRFSGTLVSSGTIKEKLCTLVLAVSGKNLFSSSSSLALPSCVHPRSCARPLGARGTRGAEAGPRLGRGPRGHQPPSLDTLIPITGRSPLTPTFPPCAPHPPMPFGPRKGLQRDKKTGKAAGGGELGPRAKSASRAQGGADGRGGRNEGAPP